MAVAAKISRSQTDAKASSMQPRQAKTKRAKSAVQSRATVHRKPLGDEEANRRSGLLSGGAGVQRKALPEEEQVQRTALADEEQVQRKAVPEEEKVQRKPEDYLEDKKKAQTAAADKNIQAASFISSPEDASEREADRVADAVTAPRAASSPPVGRSIMRALRKDGGGEGPPVAAANDNVEAKIKAAAVGGKPLSKKTRTLLEPRFGADFSEVRIHDDDQAGKLSSRIGARAFTYGRHIFFNAGQYQPDTPSGQKLLAHELTHTIQQRAAVQRKYDGLTSRPKVSESTGTQASRLGISDALDYFADAAYNIPGYRMFTIMIGINPINMREVEATTANILRAIVEFLPGGGLITTVLDQWGIFETVGTWVDEQLKTLGISGTSIKAALDEFLDSLGWSDIFDLGGVWDRAVSIFSTPIDRVITFIGSLFTQILEFVQQAVLSPLAALVSETEGYALLTQILGFDPITGEPVERTAEGIVGGLLTLAGQEELWNNIQEANALERIWEWFGTALDSLIALVMGIPDRFIEALATIEITEFLDLPAAIFKVLGVFANIVIDFGAWILETVFTLLTIIIDVVAPGLMGYLEKAGKAFDTIVNDPIGFVMNLVQAAKMGFELFRKNFIPNLRSALIQWLTGALSGAAIHIPQAFSLQEILKFILSILGVTWENVRPKLVKELGETGVAALETGFELVKTLVIEGPAAAWQQIIESIGNLRDMVIEQIISFVTNKVIEQAVIKLLSFLNPAGALIQAIIAIYNTIMFFVERLSQIAQVAAAFIDSIAEIAAGKLEPAAAKVEQTMVGLLSLVISFLARLAGLGNVGKEITNLLDKLRKPIDKAIDKLIKWIVTQAKKLGLAIKEGAQAVVDWWKEKLGFTNKAGESHTLKFMGTGDNAKLAIQTELMTVDTYLAGFSAEDKKKDEWKNARKTVDAASTIIFTRAKKTSKDYDHRAKVKAQFTKVSVALAKLGGSSPTDADYGANTAPSYGNPAKVDVIWKKPKAGSNTGAWPKTVSPWKEIFNAGLTTDTNKWVQMHIISEGLGGSGTNFANLVPAPNSANTGPFRSWELSTASMSKQKKDDIYNRVWVEVSVAGSKTSPTTISGKSGLYLWKGKDASPKWLKEASPLLQVTAPIPAPNLTGTRKLSLNFSSGTEMNRHFGVSSAIATLIKQGRPYASLDAFDASMKARGATGPQILAVMSKGAILND